MQKTINPFCACLVSQFKHKFKLITFNFSINPFVQLMYKPDNNLPVNFWLGNNNSVYIAVLPELATGKRADNY